MERNRIVYFDLLRIWGMIWVIYMHVASAPLSKEINAQWIFITMLATVAYTAVPLFFMMSGYLILTSKKTEDVSVLLRHRLPHLILPLVFWNVIIAGWIVFKNQETSLINIIKYTLTGFSSPLMQHLWFIYTLVTLYLISPLIYFALNYFSEKLKMYVLIIIGLIYVQTMVTIVVPGSLKEIFQIRSFKELNFLDGAFWIFVLGYFLGNIKKRIPKGILLTIAIVDWGFITVNTVLASIRGGGVYDRISKSESGLYGYFGGMYLFDV